MSPDASAPGFLQPSPSPWLALVTRPQAQAQEWVSKLRARGQAAQALPLLAIQGAPNPAALRAAVAAWPTQVQVMFVSPNAVHCFRQALGPDWCWPAGARALATGPGTVAALCAAGVPQAAIVAPGPQSPQFDSEALWALVAQEDWPGREVWIVRGEGGRDWLARTLDQAGARVHTLQAYARVRPVWGEPEQAVLQALRAQPARARWLISSSEALDHLAALTGPWPWHQSTALASHPRIEQACQRFGFGRVLPVGVGLEAALAVLTADRGA
ncbi:uroporphyrinogen-III synthase [Ideonella livida]|uniref:Uroporphyrinogen-III synthase n=1 Tax=Ideonella livida TaxID=2707176 RepID=A0A7C9PHR6_9BURK|nr:uroporphyrinogen-III synthase [Ideonella livida]NDY91551.1 uroporphyrinogen-III synthase [Ideonella livida]